MRPLVLVVENDNAVRVGLGAALSDAGCDAIAVGTIGTALQALTDERPDLLLASMELEGGTGLQVVAFNPRTIPAIILASYFDPVLERESRLLGAEYIVKPIAPARLIELIRQKLAAGPNAPFSPARRWQRKPLSEDVAVCVADARARVVDVSYGGLRIELERAPGAWMPLSFSVQLPPAHSSIDVDVVWKRRSGDTTWICGAAVSDADRASWQQVVDEIS